MSGYRVVYVEPGKPAAEKEIGTKLEDIQEAVGGLIECVYPHGDRTVLVCNDEGKLLGMEGNRTARQWFHHCGAVLRDWGCR